VGLKHKYGHKIPYLCYRQVLPVTSIAVHKAKSGTDTAVQKVKRKIDTIGQKPNFGTTL